MISVQIYCLIWYNITQNDRSFLLVTRMNGKKKKTVGENVKIINNVTETLRDIYCSRFEK